MIPKTVADHFKHTDPVLYQASLKLTKPIQLNPKTNYFGALCESIISQQISTKAGDAIWKRFCGLFPSNIVTPDHAITLSLEALRSIGLSTAKAKYILDLASKVSQNEIDLEQLPDLTDDEIMSILTKVKGIGPWTVEMFLMFTLGREDVFSVRDLGLKRGIQKIYAIHNDLTPDEMKRISLPWSPYRTYAALILWKSLETTK